MRPTFLRTICPLIALLLAGRALRADEPAQPNRTNENRGGFAGPNAAGQPRKWPQSKAEWLDPIHEAMNGAKYQTFASKILGRDVSYLVWLPPGYDEGAKRYPVIYWLHGMGSNQRGGAQMFVPHVEEAIKAGTLPPCIVILVNGMVRSFYCDSSDGKIPMESVIMKDLIPHVDATYRTIAKREDRIIEGVSMGGYGAAHLGFKYPDIFGTVVINAGALLDPNLTNIPKDGPMFAVFGENAARRVAEHPLTLAKQNADKLRDKTRIRIGCGSLDGLLPRNQELHDLLTKLGIAHDYEVVPDVAHDSPLYYRKLGTEAYAFHAKSLTGAAELAP